MKNNRIYWIKVKTPSILDEIFNSNLISQYKKLSLINYGTANSFVYNYHFDDDRSFWVEANGISDVLSMLSTISVEFSTPILSFHDGSFVFFNSLGRKIELDDDVKTDFKKTCKVIEMQTGYFFDLENEIIDFENDFNNEFKDEFENQFKNEFEDDDEFKKYEDNENDESDIEYEFNFLSKNNLNEKTPNDSFEFNNEGDVENCCGSCECNCQNEETIESPFEFNNDVENCCGSCECDCIEETENKHEIKDDVVPFEQMLNETSKIDTKSDFEEAKKELKFMEETIEELSELESELSVEENKKENKSMEETIEEFSNYSSKINDEDDENDDDDNSNNNHGSELNFINDKEDEKPNNDSKSFEEIMEELCELRSRLEENADDKEGKESGNNQNEKIYFDITNEVFNDLKNWKKKDKNENQETIVDEKSDEQITIDSFETSSQEENKQEIFDDKPLDDEKVEEEKSKEQIIKELFEIASDEEYDDDSNENKDVSESDLDDVFMDTLKEQIENVEDQDEQDKSDINDILKFFNDDNTKNNDLEFYIDEINLNESFTPETISFKLDTNKDLEEDKTTFENLDSNSEENEFDKLVNQALQKDENDNDANDKNNIQSGCNQEDCKYCFDTCSCSQVFDNYEEADNLVAKTFNIENNNNVDDINNSEYFESQIDDFSIYEYEEPCCEDKFEYYNEETNNIDNQTNSYNFKEENDMDTELDKNIDGFKEIGFDETKKVLNDLFDTNNSLEYVLDSTKDDVENILKRIEVLREKNTNSNNISSDSEIDLKPIYELLKKGDVTLDIYSEESKKFIIEKLNGLLSDIEDSNNFECSNEKDDANVEITTPIKEENEFVNNDETFELDEISSNDLNLEFNTEINDDNFFKEEIIDNGKVIELDEIVASDLNSEFNTEINDENIFEEKVIDNGEIIELDEISSNDLNLEFNSEIKEENMYENSATFELNENDNQFKTIDDVLDSKFGSYNQNITSNTESTNSSFETFDDILDSKFGGFQKTPTISYEFTPNNSDSAIDTVLEQKFAFNLNEQKQVNLNIEIDSNFDSVLDEKFGGYNTSNAEASNNWNSFDYEFKPNEDIKLDNDFDFNSFGHNSIVDFDPIETSFEFNDEIITPLNIIDKNNIDSFDDSINDLEFNQELNNLESENLFNDSNLNINDEPLVDLNAFDKPEEIESISLEKVEDPVEAIETLFDNNDDSTNITDSEEENLYKNIYDDVVSNDNNLNDALKLDEELELSNSELSFETSPYENNNIVNKKQTLKNNINNLFNYDHSRIDLERIKANSESQKAVINGLSEFLKKIEVEKNKLQQKREEIEKKNELAKQIISQGYNKQNNFNFEKRNWR